MVLFSFLKLLFLGASTVVLASMVVVVAAVDARAAYHLCQVWARVNLIAFGVHVHVRRRAPLDATAAYVFMSNHRSQLDVLAVVAALPEFQVRWVAKKELARIPFFGWALKWGGHIVIDRGDHAQAVATLRAAQTQTDAGISVIIFPEGTRAPGDEVLLPFKKGGFMLAIQSGLPVVPMVVRGSRALLPRGTWRVRAGTIDVVVGAPIPVAGVARDDLMERVGAFMRAELGLPAAAAVPVAVRAS